ncbi:MAG: glycosyltransferase family 39 protein [Paludibacteraceae bacterium]|nr:glycosyltransferase family 39 protein [Paludibacteraceae bacterium]
MDKNKTYFVRCGLWTLLLIVLLWSLRYVFEGLGNVMDPLYWMHKYAHAEGGWMASGTIVIGHVLVELLGEHLMPLRLVAWLCVVAAIVLPYCMLLSSEQRKANVSWLVVAMMLVNYGTFQEFSPATLTVLCLSALWCILIRFQRTKKRVWLIALGVVTGMAIVVRFPNILVLPILLGALCVANDQSWKKRLGHIVWYLCAVLIGAGVLYGVAWVMMKPAYMDAAMGSHQISKMIEQLWTKGALLFGMAAIWVGVVFVGRELNKRWSQAPWCNAAMYYVGLIVGFLLAHYIAFALKRTQWYNMDLTYMISALCLVLAIMSKKKEVGWGALLMVVAPLGTDTAWMKLFPAVLCLLPIAAVEHRKEIYAYLLPLLFVFAFAVMMRFSTNSVGKCDLSQVDTWASVPPYEHIKVTAQEAEWLEQVKADYAQYADSNATIVAVGQRMHMVREVTGCQAAVYNEFWSNIFDKVYTEKYKEYVCRERPIIFCTFAPHFKTKPTYKDTQSALEDMLRAEGYREIDRSEYKYMIYIPSND